MLPVNPAGHRGSRRGPDGIGAAGWPRSASARRAQRRAVMNSLRRPATAWAITVSSPGNGASPGMSVNSSYDTTHDGSKDWIITSDPEPGGPDRARRLAPDTEG